MKVKLENLKVGDTVVPDDSFDCLLPEDESFDCLFPGVERQVMQTNGELYIVCFQGKHFLGKHNTDQEGYLIGLTGKEAK